MASEEYLNGHANGYHNSSPHGFSNGDAPDTSSDTITRLIDLRPGERFANLPCLIVEKQPRTTKNGAPFLSLTVRDSTAQVQASWFQNFQQLDGHIETGKVLLIRGRVNSEPPFRGNLVIDGGEPASTEIDKSTLLPALPADHAAHRLRFNDLIRSVHCQPLKDLLKEIFQQDGELWKAFELAPAAKGMHHAYMGGLLEHSGEVASLCDRIASTLPHLDRDLLVTAALVHDIGKLEEMDSANGAVQYTAVGHLVGHVVLGTCTVANAAERVPDFPPALKHELMHLILSHHGRLEFGAAKHPMCAEAIVLSLCDLMSAKVAQCREKAGAAECPDFTDRKDSYGWESGNIYLGAMKRMMELGLGEEG
jgi:3'-5' exoribonuclease